MDLDMISLKSLESVQPNFFGRENEGLTSGAILNFEHNSIGHEMASMILQ